MLAPEEYRGELKHELIEILGYWLRHAPDPVNGGFYGRIDNDNLVYPDAPRGVVLYSRILYIFSAAYLSLGQPAYLSMAEKAYDCLIDHFTDNNFGGVYWSVDFTGQPIDTKKHIYGHAFCLLGLSEYYKASKKLPALEAAIHLYRTIEKNAYDPERKGYYEAFTREWKKPADCRLFPQDPNEPKSMKTHLHLLEAYAALYDVWKNAGLRGQIENLLEVFAHHFVDHSKHHLNLFFDEDWNLGSELISFGHDIEAAWIMQRAAEAIRHPGWTVAMKSLAVKIAEAAAGGLDADGALKYELNAGRWVDDKIWWAQAEAMVGFYNAYEVSGEEKFLRRSIRTWVFITENIKDNSQGEWFWGVHADHSPMQRQDKAGFWKCPYHNGRACIELIRRITPQYAFGTKV